jgi:hypothetical protein
MEDIKFNFGKYKGLRIAECEDYIYLCKCLQHGWGFKNKDVVNAINERVVFGIRNKKF